MEGAQERSGTAAKLTGLLEEVTRRSSVFLPTSTRGRILPSPVLVLIFTGHDAPLVAGSLLLPCGSHRPSSGHWAWWQAPNPDS